MSHLTKIFLTAACLFTSVSSSASAQARPDDPATAKMYRDLIAALASPNPKGITKGGEEPSVSFPAGYDWQAQKKVYEARQTLLDSGASAFPYLMEALDDERYSMTINWADGTAYLNHSVGDVCQDVIACHLEVYRDKIRFSDAPQWRRYNYPVSAVWWRPRSGKTLAELQIEAMDWAIIRRQADEFAGDPAEEVAALQKFRDEIAKTKKPASPNRPLRMILRGL